VKYILPKSLRKSALKCFQHTKDNNTNIGSYKTVFLSEYFSLNFSLELSQRISNSIQSQDESLGKFAQRIPKIYFRMQKSPDEQTQCHKI